MPSNSSTLIFHGELKELLPSDNQNGELKVFPQRKASIKDIIESMGPPHTEISKLKVDGTQADFNYILQGQETVHVYPHLPPVDVTKASALQNRPLGKLRFVVDVNIGKIAKLLRMLGFDTAYHWSWSDKYIARIAEKEGRVVLTKDRGLLKRKNVDWGRLIRGDSPEEQLKEILHFFGINQAEAPFSRCLRCNSLLVPVDKSEIIHRLEPKTKKYFHRFYMCRDCDRIFWPGSHQDKMLDWLELVKENGQAN